MLSPYITSITVGKHKVIFLKWPFTIWNYEDNSILDMSFNNLLMKKMKKVDATSSYHESYQ